MKYIAHQFTDKVLSNKYQTNDIEVQLDTISNVWYFTADTRVSKSILDRTKMEMKKLYPSAIYLYDITQLN